MPSAAQSLQHRRDLAELTRIAEQDLAVLWRQFSTASEARDGLLDVLPQMVAVYGSAAATLGADWYDDMREAGGVGGSFRAVPFDFDDMGAAELARWAVGPLFRTEPDWETALSLAVGGLQRRIVNADRYTVTGSSVADPRARGWARAGIGECDFCEMLIGRGAVYSQESADFLSHDRCGCIAVPDFG